MNFGPGTIGREATAAQVHVLAMAASSLGGDVLGLKLADSTAAVYATEVGPITTPTTPPPATPLPKTGGSVPLPLGLGLLALAGLSATLVKRSRAV
jgi:LPXTG-motif cell wall-anchored protein